MTLSITPTMPTYNNSPISADTPSNQIGAVDTRGGIITIDQPLQEFFKKLHIGTGGTLVVLGRDNQPIVYQNILNGDWLFVLGYAVLSSCVINSVTYTTTASNIDWYGGC